jgi:hypothetical protein
VSRTFPHAFKVEEANALLPTLETLFRKLDRPRAELETRMGRIQVLDLIWGARLRDPDNPDRGEFLEERAALRRTLQEIEKVVDARFRPLGVRFPPGGLEHGLVDFPTTLDGRWVFLCWRRGESEIRAWHEISGGVRGRQPLTPEEAARMGVDGDAEDPPEATEGGWGPGP